MTGGIPLYLEEINPALSAEDNIKAMCFTKGALLADEFNRIFLNIFLRNSETYKKIVEILAMGDKEFNEICVPYSIINEVQQKIDRLKRPKGMSCRPVLIQVNGVDEEVEE